MPILRDLSTNAGRSVGVTKLRSFLTMFGILWGITSVILLVGLGIGFGIDQREQLKTIGTDIAICFPRQDRDALRRVCGRAARCQLTIDDAIAIQQGAPLVKNVSPETTPHRKRSEPVECCQPRSARRLARLPGLSLAPRRAGPADECRR